MQLRLNLLRGIDPCCTRTLSDIERSVHQVTSMSESWWKSFPEPNTWPHNTHIQTRKPLRLPCAWVVLNYNPVKGQQILLKFERLPSFRRPSDLRNGKCFYCYIKYLHCVQSSLVLWMKVKMSKKACRNYLLLNTMYSPTTLNVVVPGESNVGLYNIDVLKSTPFSFTN